MHTCYYYYYYHHHVYDWLATSKVVKLYLHTNMFQHAFD